MPMSSVLHNQSPNIRTTQFYYLFLTMTKNSQVLDILWCHQMNIHYKWSHKNLMYTNSFPYILVRKRAQFQSCKAQIDNMKCKTASATGSRRCHDAVTRDVMIFLTSKGRTSCYMKTVTVIKPLYFSKHQYNSNPNILKYCSFVVGNILRHWNKKC